MIFQTTVDQSSMLPLFFPLFSGLRLWAQSFINPLSEVILIEWSLNWVSNNFSQYMTISFHDGSGSPGKMCQTKLSIHGQCWVADRSSAGRHSKNSSILSGSFVERIIWSYGQILWKWILCSSFNFLTNGISNWLDERNNIASTDIINVSMEGAFDNKLYICKPILLLFSSSNPSYFSPHKLISFEDGPIVSIIPVSNPKSKFPRMRNAFRRLYDRGGVGFGKCR